MNIRKYRWIAPLSAALVAGTAAIVAASTGNANAAAENCGYLFDDFSYSSSSDPNLSAHGWIARANAGGPGVPGATWSPNNITFPTNGGQKVMQLTASTDGTGAGTNHAELFSAQKRYKEGTYASRVRFTDTPVAGSDGDHINETFFTISPLAYDLDPTYSELDVSEYLPNGGWGETGPINYQTTWYTYRNEPWFADNVHSEQRRSLDGWHDLVVQVANGHVVYWIDGVQVGDHSGKYYPRQTMTINWNLWFIDLATHSGGLSTYIQQVDWVLFAKNSVLSPAQMTGQVSSYRAAGNAFTDTVDSAGPCTTPTNPPATSTPPSPSNPPTSQPPATGCNNAPEWSISAQYNTGALVKHEKSANGDPNGAPSGQGKHLWRARWWTQGSEPGWTQQWEDLGRC
ncbi:glycosyl hydrolase [Virgisporangium aliadipatigenens]|uniref:Glycosyl hydrolase n=1 Tax=Virgisporangium aliadipatigenens TaxID=741659 RepID=A0A8J4DM07_9ACTN|nr:glycosyl hydrolase [Virgisporangium aliadipatigenens]GIJ43285.1 glycosyl hydrolase [Virgisporangium aliadipatigenens]